MSDWLCRFLTAHNVTHRYDEIESGRGNVIARIDGDPDLPTVLLDAHQDTVPVAGMTIDPFEPVEDRGRLYGRGACDVKGAMASMLSAVVRLNRDRRQSHASLVITLTCDEELGQLGARHLVRQIGKPDSLLPVAPDLAIVAEPTQLDVVVAHKGTVRWTLETTGVATHSSRPQLGKNAIYTMARLVEAMEQIAAETQSSGLTHPLCGTPTLSVGTIRGGQSVNIVPDRCLIEIDRRVVPGESVEALLSDIAQELRQRTGLDFRMLPPSTTCDPLVDGENQDLANALTSIAAPIAGSSTAVGVAFTTQAPKFAAAGIPTVVFGPGSIDQAHTKNEWIQIDQLDQSAEILYQFVREVGQKIPEREGP